MAFMRCGFLYGIAQMCEPNTQKNYFVTVTNICDTDNTEKNGFVTATILGTTNEFFVASTKNFAAATKRFVDRTKNFVVTKYFCYPYFNK